MILATVACLSGPVISTASPETIGTQIASESKDTPCIRSSASLLSSPFDDDQREQYEDAENHRERVVIDVTRLQVPQDLRRPADEPSRAVHHETVDQSYVADFPQPGAREPRAACEKPRVQLVESVLAVEYPVEDIEPARDDRRKIGPKQVQIDRRGDARDREPEGHRHRRMQHHRHDAVELPGHMRHRLMSWRDDDCVTEIAA